MPGSGRIAEPGLPAVTPGSGLIMIAPVSVCHHVSTIGQRSPPMTLAVPDPRLGVDRLTDRAEQPQRRQVVLVRDLLAPLHERADRGRRRVEDRDAVLLDDLPPAALVRVVGRALVHDLRRAVRERAVDDVAVAGDPADVGGAPVDVGLGLEVEDRVVRVRRADQVAAGRVQDALGLAGRAGGVHDVERVLGVEGLGARARRTRGRRRRATTRRGRRSTPRPGRCAGRRARSRRAVGTSRSASSTVGLRADGAPRR